MSGTDVSSAVMALLVAAGCAVGGDAVRFNTFPPAAPICVITPRSVPADTYSDVGISWAGNGYVDVRFTAPYSMTVDKLFFQCSDMYTPGLFHVDLYVNEAWKRYVSIADIDAYYTLTDVEWDFETNLVVYAGDTVRLRFDHDTSMTGSGSTAARLVSSTETNGAVFTGVWNDFGYTPMALVPEPSGSTIILR